MVLLDPQLVGDGRLGFQMAVLSVHRNRIFGMHKRIDQLDLLLAGMSRHMSILEDHIGALGGQLVDNLRHRFLIARNRIGTEDNRISRHDMNLPVQVLRHPGQSSHGLSLASRGDQDRRLRRIVMQLLNIDERILRNPDISKFHCRRDDIDHAPAFHHDFLLFL